MLFFPPAEVPISNFSLSEAVSVPSTSEQTSLLVNIILMIRHLEFNAHPSLQVLRLSVTKHCAENDFLFLLWEACCYSASKRKTTSHLNVLKIGLFYFHFQCFSSKPRFGSDIFETQTHSGLSSYSQRSIFCSKHVDMQAKHTVNSNYDQPEHVHSCIRYGLI